MRESKLDLRSYQNCAVGHIRGDCLFQRLKPLRRVMKVGDGVVQSRRRQVHAELLESSEGLSRLKRLPRGGNGIISVGCLDETIHTPIAVITILVQRSSVPGRNKCERAPATVGFTCRLSGKMRRHPLDVFHHGDWVLEDFVVNALKQVANKQTCLLEDNAVGVVDVAAAVGCGADKISFYLKLACYDV